MTHTGRFRALGENKPISRSPRTGTFYTSNEPPRPQEHAGQLGLVENRLETG